MSLFEEESWRTTEKADQLNRDLFSSSHSSKMKTKKKVKSEGEPKKSNVSKSQPQNNESKEKTKKKRKRLEEAESNIQIGKKRKLYTGNVEMPNRFISNDTSGNKVKKTVSLPAPGVIPKNISHAMKKRIAYRDWAMKKNQERKAAAWSKKLKAKSCSKVSTLETEEAKTDKKGKNKKGKKKTVALRNKYKDYDTKKKSVATEKGTNDSLDKIKDEQIKQSTYTVDSINTPVTSDSQHPSKKKPNKRNKYKHLLGVKKQNVAVTPRKPKDFAGGYESSSDSELEDILNGLLKPKSKWLPSELFTETENKLAEQPSDIKADKKGKKKKVMAKYADEDSACSNQQCASAVKQIGKVPFDISQLKSVLESANTGTQSTISSDESEGDSPDVKHVKAKKDKGKTVPLRDRMVNQLQSARFRFLNEQLYKITGSEALQLMSENKDAFQVYHEGYQAQVGKWPTNPVDKMISFIKARPSSFVVADFGCGEAKIAHSVPNTVHSFDLVAANRKVTVCDIANVPLGKNSVDIGVFCLSLMGTNVVDFLCEANRVLKKSGLLLIAEVISRFEKLGKFIHKMEKLGFVLQNKDATNRMFVWLEFKKTGTPNMSRLPEIHLAPCLYKKR